MVRVLSKLTLKIQTTSTVFQAYPKGETRNTSLMGQVDFLTRIFWLGCLPIGLHVFLDNEAMGNRFGLDG